MLDVSNIVGDLIGNGYTETEILEISNELTSFTISREKLFEKLSTTYENEELKDILMTIEASSLHHQIMAKVLKRLSPREKECYLMHAVENKSWGNIAKELGVSKGRVQQAINRAKVKIEKLKREDAIL